MTVTGVDMNRGGIPNVSQQPQVSYSALLPYGTPVEASIFQGANVSLQFVWLWVSVLSWMIFLSVFSPGLGNQSLAFSVVAYDSLRLLFLHAGLQSLQIMPKSPRTTTRGWLLCTPISFLFLGSTMTLSSFLGKDSSSLLQPNAV